MCLFTVSGPLWVSLPPPHAASCSRCECVLSAGSSTRSCWCKSARPLKDQDGLSGLINGLVARPAAADTVFRRRTGSAGDIPRLLVGSFFFPLFLFLGSPTLFVLIVTAATPPAPQRWQRRSGGGGDEQQKVWGKVSNKWCLGMCAQLACVGHMLWRHRRGSRPVGPVRPSRPSPVLTGVVGRGASGGGGGVRGQTPRTRGHGNTAGLRS